MNEYNWHTISHPHLWVLYDWKQSQGYRCCAYTEYVHTFPIMAETIRYNHCLHCWNDKVQPLSTLHSEWMQAMAKLGERCLKLHMNTLAFCIGDFKLDVDIHQGEKLFQNQYPRIPRDNYRIVKQTATTKWTTVGVCTIPSCKLPLGDTLQTLIGVCIQV